MQMDYETMFQKKFKKDEDMSIEDEQALHDELEKKRLAKERMIVDQREDDTVERTDDQILHDAN